jgi:chromosomal replication initiator protein
MLRHKSFARFVTFPENQSAFLAVQDLIDSLRAGKLRSPNPLFLHGPPGTGKTHLVSGLANEIAATGTTSIKVLAATDFRESAVRESTDLAKGTIATSEAAPPFSALAADAQECDLLILEDLQHLRPTAVETLVQIIDHRQAHQLPMVFTAVLGPRHLAHRGVPFPTRLTSRLAGGLVIAMDPLSSSSRQRLLEEMAQKSQFALPRDIAVWLAQNLTGGGRQLAGAISQLQTLNKVGRRALDLKSIAAHFSALVEATRPTIERIAAQVAGCFRIETRQLQSRRRYHNVVLPRQIGMYLARQLTSLSLQQIGAYFGGRDHTTVLHACRKVEQAMKGDAVLSGTIRQIHAALV